MQGMQTRQHRYSALTRTIGAAALCAAVVAGCSSGGSGGGGSKASLPDAATLLQQSAQTTKGLQSAHVEITVDGKIEGLPVKKLSGDLTNVPATAASAKATITMGGSDLDADIVVTESTLFAALSPNNWLDMGPAADIYDPSTILHPDSGLANVLGNFSGPKSEATEKINGIETVKVTGQVSAEAANRILPQLKVTGPIPGTAWIQPDGDHNLVQARLQPSDGAAVQMTLSDWNKPVTVTKPQI